jgi:hypothetical protein
MKRTGSRVDVTEQGSRRAEGTPTNSPGPTAPGCRVWSRFGSSERASPSAAGRQLRGVQNETAVYRVVLQPFMCHCRTGERKRLHMGLARPAAAARIAAVAAGRARSLWPGRKNPAEKPGTARFPRQIRLLSAVRRPGRWHGRYRRPGTRLAGGRCPGSRQPGRSPYGPRRMNTLIRPTAAWVTSMVTSPGPGAGSAALSAAVPPARRSRTPGLLSPLLPLRTPRALLGCWPHAVRG